MVVTYAPTFVGAFILHRAFIYVFERICIHLFEIFNNENRADIRILFKKKNTETRKYSR
jgi:hypothetical protein